MLGVEEYELCERRNAMVLLRSKHDAYFLREETKVDRERKLSSDGIYLSRRHSKTSKEIQQSLLTSISV